MTKKIYTFLNDPQNVFKLSDEIASDFINKACKENLNFSFDIAKGTGKLKTRQPNTFLCYDPDPGGFTHQFKKALHHEDLKDLEENSEEEKKLVKDINEFIKKVAEEIISGYSLSIRETIRKIVLPKSNEKMIPLSKIEIITIDIADYDSIPEPAKYLLKVGKQANTMVDTGEVTKLIHERQEETGQTVEEVFELEKRKESRLFKNVLAVELGERYLYDVSLTLFVDYSLSNLPPNPFGN